MWPFRRSITTAHQYKKWLQESPFEVGSIVLGFPPFFERGEIVKLGQGRHTIRWANSKEIRNIECDEGILRMMQRLK